MEEKRVTYPTVFISYAWGRNKDRVKSLADRLLADGVQVKIDIYDLEPGMNKHAFMQKLVNDPTIEKVLMLCDEEYKRKADDFKGGVGEEATIISPEVYGNVEQTKFIPVVLENDSTGQPYLPTMVRSLIYIDLSDATTEQAQYEKLVRNLWGLPDQRKPPLAEKPKWLERPAANTVGIEAQLAVQEAQIRRTPNDSALAVRVSQEFLLALNALQDTARKEFDLLGLIAETEPIRNCFVRYVENGLQQEGFTGERIGSLIEKLYNGIEIENGPFALGEVYHFFFWDIFICATALLLEYERFADLHMLLNRTYFLRNIIGTQNDPQPFTYSEFRHYCKFLEDHFKSRINPRLISLAADILVKREYGAVITKRSLAVADVTLAHLAMLYGRAKSGFTWFPALHCYTNYAGYALLWERLPSRRFCEKLFPLFDVTDMEDFKKQIKKMSDAWAEAKMASSYYGGFGIPLVLGQGDFEKIGTMP